MSRGRVGVLLAAFLLCGVFPEAGAATSGTEIQVRKVPSSEDRAEQYERDVDQVALASQEQAIAKLSTLLKKYRGTSQEPVLLSRLAEFQQQHSAILFRITHGYSRKNGTIDTSRYNKSLNQCIATLDLLIRKYPSNESIPHAYFMRAKAYEELNKKTAAVADYQYLVKKFPDAEDTPAAYMALAEVAIAANEHPKAIQYLTEVEKLPKDPHYPFALYKLGWSQYNLKNIPQAISFLERHVEYYRESAALQGATDTAVVSEKALQENSLLDIVLFYFEGYESRDPRYALSGLLPYMRKLEAGTAFGRMTVKMAKLLRSHGHEADLMRWKDQVLSEEGSRPESLDVVITAYDYQLGKRRFNLLVDLARDYVKVYAKHAADEAFKPMFVHAQKQLIDTAEGLQQILLKNKGNDEVRPLSMTLAAIYDSFTRIVEESDPRVPRVHYNLAETLFAIKDFEGATHHYRWVAQHGKGDADANAKAIAARYEVLRQKKLASVELKPVALPEDSSSEDDIKLDPLLREWVSWIDTHMDRYPVKGKKEAGKIESFLFEANRALYAGGRVSEACERFRKFAEKYPLSSFAIPSATLVVDSTIATGKWSRTHELVLQFLDESAWKETEFGKRLSVLAADSYFKIMEEGYEKKDYAAVLKSAEKFFKRYNTSERFADVLRISGLSAQAAGDALLAKHYYSRLIAERPKSDGVGDALLARAVMNEENFEFAAAAADYRAFLGLEGERFKKAQTDALRKKTLALSWLGGDPVELRGTLANKSVCAESVEQECDKYQALALLKATDRLGSEAQTADALARAKKTSGENQALWSLVALEGYKHLEYRERLFVIRHVASGWEDLGALEKFAILPNLSRALPRAYAANRAELRTIAPLKANEKWVKRRVEVIRELENHGTAAMKLPWSRIRAEILNQVANLYVDFSKELAAVPAPKNLPPEEIAAYEDTIRKLVMPFEEKGQELRRKAFEIASHFAIEDESFREISEGFFADNPSQAKSLKPAQAQLPPVPEFSFWLLPSLDPTGDWTVVSNRGKADKTRFDTRLKLLWVSSLEKQNWPQVAFLMAEAKNRKSFSEGALLMMQAFSLTQVGARGEGLVELDAARKYLTGDPRTIASLILVGFSVRACSKERIPEWLADMKLEQLNRAQKLVYVAGSSYVAAGSQKR